MIVKFMLRLKEISKIVARRLSVTFASRSTSPCHMHIGIKLEYITCGLCIYFIWNCHFEV